MNSERTNGKKQARPAPPGRVIPTWHTQMLPVWLEYHNKQVREVSIAGSFNNWDVLRTRMVHAGRGRWVRVLFLPPGRYEYLFVVDGRCVADPRATEKAPNVFGCVNSVLFVPASVSGNGCRRMPARKPPGSMRPPVKLKPRLCRRANMPCRHLRLA